MHWRLVRLELISSKIHCKESSVGETTDSINLIYEVVKDALETQQNQKNGLENKASALIAFAGVIFGLLMGASPTLSVLQPRESQYLILVSVALFAVSVVLANIVAWVRKYRADPNPPGLAEKYLMQPEDATRRQILSNWLERWKRNNALNERNAVILRWAYLVQAAGFLLLALALLLTIK